MKIRILGFEPVPSLLPNSVPPTAGFDWMRENAGTPLGKVTTTAVAPIDGWLAGVVLKSRDATSFTKMLREDGIGKVTTERLPDGHQLAEASFSVVHPETGRGLYAHHHRAASLSTDFAWTCAKTFHLQRQKLLETHLAAAPDLSTKDKAALRKEHRGRFCLSQLLNQGSLKDFLKTL